MTTTLGNLIMKNELESASNMTYPRNITSATTLGNLTMDDEFHSAFMTNLRNITSALNRTTILGNLTMDDEFETASNMTNLRNIIRNLTMDDEFESTTKGPEPNPKSALMRRCTKITVEGYDTCSPLEEIKTALKDHFSSCGEIISVCIPRDTIRYASIYILGEGAEQKALDLHGSIMGGCRLLVLPLKESARSARAHREYMSKKVCVQGFDHSIPKGDISSALTNHFSSCGEIVKVSFGPRLPPFFDLDKIAVILIEGEDAQEKALQLNGSDMGGCKLIVTPLYTPYCHDIPQYTVPARFLPKKKKTKKNKNKYHT